MAFVLFPAILSSYYDRPGTLFLVLGYVTSRFQIRLWWCHLDITHDSGFASDLLAPSIRVVRFCTCFEVCGRGGVKFSPHVLQILDLFLYPIVTVPDFLQSFGRTVDLSLLSPSGLSLPLDLNLNLDLVLPFSDCSLG